MSGPTPKPGIMNIAPYVGGESSLDGQDRIIKLSSNEGAFGPSPLAQAAYTDAASDLHRYPDGGCVALRAAIAELNGLEADRIVCGAGSDEIISLLCQAYAGAGDEVLYSQHGFLMYAISAKAAGATPVFAPETNLTSNVDALLGAVSDNTRLLFLANPNNPTGTYLSGDELWRLRRELRDDIILVIDAAYAEYASRDDYTPGVDLVDGGGNVVMTRTFSKIYGLGGVRLGWAYCPAGIADVLNRIRGPFNVGSPALAAGLAALGDSEFIERARTHNDTWLEWTRSQFLSLGLEVPPSAGNFVLVRFPEQPGRNADIAEACDTFLKSRGIIVRRMDAYGLDDCLRVTIGLKDEMQAAFDAFKEFLEQI
ncbi:MAG: histidinol-phosphate transaminase [Rhodospirillales bacterium]|nr:histidinol-phosphate transaminase [Alphaproteobacteria bacterium]MBL6948048.1 histidinol-phosphate transaminase [Rhodospirillales bacterium]